MFKTLEIYMKNLALVLILLSIISCQSEKQLLQLPSIFSDNLVLQQNEDVKIWGKYKPGEKISVTGSWNQKSETTVDESGNWLLSLQTPSAGGPYSLNIITADTSLQFNNVLIGEVWLCSGQSNMEMPLKGWPPRDLIENSETEINNSANNQIRMITVPRFASLFEEENFNGEWKECNPVTAADFSATAYFFGKKLYEELNIPIGLIHSSWGGTPAESWTKAIDLSQLNDFKTIVSDLEKSRKNYKKLIEWKNSFPVYSLENKPDETRWENLDFGDSLLSKKDFNDSRWETMKVPSNWNNTELAHFDGVVWFRKIVDIPEKWRGEELLLELGPIDDMDVTYVNGVKVGANEKSGLWQLPRKYSVPAELTSEKELVISVRVLDNMGGGGMYGKAVTLKPVNSKKSISLAGEWKYLPVAEYGNFEFVVYGFEKDVFANRPELPLPLSQHTPSALFNAMINPLVPYTIKGAIWYQGESNSSRASQYIELFPKMINSWRKAWNQGDFPFYFVQIAPFDYGNIESQYLREAQFKTLSVENTGMAVTLDIGNFKNIHPGNKKDVGERLARWALNKDYKKNIVPSGPIYRSSQIVNNQVILYFDYADGLNIKKINGKNNFKISGDGKYYFDAIVQINNSNLIVHHPKVKKPVSIRYAFSNFGGATLFNGAGLPATSFRTDNF